MGVSACVAAIKQISDEEHKIIDAYNILYEGSIEPSEELREEVRKITGMRLDWDEAIELGSDYVELNVNSEGDADYGRGMLVSISDLPPGTVTLRIYMQ